MVKPLTKRTMTLDELHRRTLDVIEKMKCQLHKSPYQEGLTDSEFIDEVLTPFQTEIQQDRDVLGLRGGEL